MEEIAEKLGAKFPLRLPKTVVCEDYESVSLFNAEQIAEVVNRIPDALICVPNDATAIRTYEILEEMKNQNKVSFRQAQFISLYEWIGDNNKSENCSDFLQKYLYDC
jgi:6-phosphogluconolactonase/glucosamine-6-phosphate isomerase/deaminase